MNTTIWCKKCGRMTIQDGDLYCELCGEEE